MAVINDIVQVYSGRDGNTLIFTQTKLEADTLGRAPLMKGRVQVLHGDIAQQRREQVLKVSIEQDNATKQLAGLVTSANINDHFNFKAVFPYHKHTFKQAYYIRLAFNK